LQTTEGADLQAGSFSLAVAVTWNIPYMAGSITLYSTRSKNGASALDAIDYLLYVRVDEDGSRFER